MAIKIRDKRTGKVYTMNANSVDEATNMYKSGNYNLSSAPEVEQEQPIDTDKLLRQYNTQAQELKPYREGLENLINNYPDIQRRAMARDEYYAGLAGWSGNRAFENMIGKYNPAEIEATRLDLLNKLAQSNIAEQQTVNSIPAVAKMMQRAGMPAEMALVDPSMISKMSNIISAQTAADARKYAAKLNYDARIYDTRLDNMIAYANQMGRNDVALELQRLKNQNRLQTSYIGQLPWMTDLGALNNAYSQFSGNPIYNIYYGNTPESVQVPGVQTPVTRQDVVGNQFRNIIGH